MIDGPGALAKLSAIIIDDSCGKVNRLFKEIAPGIFIPALLLLLLRASIKDATEYPIHKDEFRFGFEVSWSG